MERQIKFRAWHKKRKKFYEVLLLHMKSILSATCKGYDIIEQKDIHIRVQPEDCIIMQYTGLKDKDGKEIYEGDILQSEFSGMTDDTHIEINMVIFKDGCFCNSLDEAPLYSYNDVSIVIGNIYENPAQLAASNP